MRTHPSALFVVLAVMTVSGEAENVRDEASRLIAADVKSGGKSVPKGPKPMALLKPEERKTYDERDPEILILPKVEVTAPEITPFEKQLEQLDHEQAWEERSTKLSWLEALLNGKAFANARTERAKARVEIMNWERMLLIALVGAKTDEERAQIRSEIRMFKAMRR
jgi:hypothetical protein